MINTCILQKDIDKLKKQEPNISEQEILCHVLKFQIPATIPRSPSWHRRNLKDLMTMVEYWGTWV